MRILKTILSIIFPTFCITCRGKDYIFCFSCIEKIQISEKEVNASIYPIYDYRDKIIKKAIWSLKYKNRKGLARVFAGMLYPKILEELSDLSMLENFKNPLLIPIPLSRKRLRERGFNQSLLIAKELVKIDQGSNFKLEKNILIKSKETIHQALIKNRKERLKNLIGSFAVKNNSLIQKRNIILIDDVVTTGATFKEANKVLRESGARKIIMFTIAH